MQGESLLFHTSPFARLPVTVVSITALPGLAALYVSSMLPATHQYLGASAVAGLSATPVAVFLLSRAAMSAAKMPPSGLSPFANSCLQARRRPFGFLARHWHGGDGAVLRATRIGFSYRHACAGYRVAILALMFVVGMANIALVIVTGALIVGTKSSTDGVEVARLLAIFVMASGGAVALGWLQLPDYFR